MTSEFPRSAVARLILIAFLAVLVQGYHLGVDDAEIYEPAIKRAADPSLYPFGSEFFMSHAHWSLFPELVGMPARLTHLPIDFDILLARSLHLSSLTGVLATRERLFYEQRRAVERSCSVGGDAECAGRRHSAGHHGPVPDCPLAFHVGDDLRDSLLPFKPPQTGRRMVDPDRSGASTNGCIRSRISRVSLV